jgi:hypothetical protein
VKNNTAFGSQRLVRVFSNRPRSTSSGQALAGLVRFGIENPGFHPISANLYGRQWKSEKALVFCICNSPQKRHPESL